MSPERRGVALRALVALVLLALVLANVDLGAVLDLLRGIDTAFFALCLTLVFLDRCFTAYKWNLLTQVKGISLSVWQSIRIYLIANFIGLFLPTGIGGDVYRIYHTSQQFGRTEASRRATLSRWRCSPGWLTGWRCCRVPSCT